LVGNFERRAFCTRTLPAKASPPMPPSRPGRATRVAVVTAGATGFEIVVYMTLLLGIVVVNWMKYPMT